MNPTKTFAFFLVAALHAFASDAQTHSLFMTVENDTFGGRTDRYYTQGIYGGYYHDEGHIYPVLTNILDKIPHLGWKAFRIEQNRWGLALGQNMYTPRNIAATALQLSDRPYGGWLYGGFILERRGTDFEGQVPFSDHFELDIGVIGPAAQAGTVQDWWHRDVLGIPQAQGWDNQLKNEPGFSITWKRSYQVSTDLLYKDTAWSSDLLPEFGLTLGNVSILSSIGTTWRMGYNLPEAHPRPIGGPGILSGTGLKREPKWGVYVFGGAEGRVVGRNIFLDGNTWQSSHSVDKIPLVADLKGGCAVHYRGVSLAYTYVVRTREFTQQVSAQKFGSVSIQCAF